ncbi:hypothetical protein M407DRAFT_227049 [Tulasnella calospora MUT 4182]|uniref:Uncharacterized protein n=1 Tax=Tulasnella calospora MUT 4182 TaxID=1051891 RepID=A0A0C3MJN5_9AGAM|nr:hypothetical protein M407DRAFT_227049 [Tulasnella calospora MUT 4182]
MVRRAKEEGAARAMGQRHRHVFRRDSHELTLVHANLHQVYHIGFRPFIGPLDEPISGVVRRISSFAYTCGLRQTARVVHDSSVACALLGDDKVSVSRSHFWVERKLVEQSHYFGGWAAVQSADLGLACLSGCILRKELFFLSFNDSVHPRLSLPPPSNPNHPPSGFAMSSALKWISRDRNDQPTWERERGADRVPRQTESDIEAVIKRYGEAESRWNDDSDR